MNKPDFQPYLDAASDHYPETIAIGREPYAVCINSTNAPYCNCEYLDGVWVQAWVWVPHEEAVKARLLRGSEG